MVSFAVLSRAMSESIRTSPVDDEKLVIVPKTLFYISPNNKNDAPRDDVSLNGDAIFFDMSYIFGFGDANIHH